jgi:hypothetical protein
MNRATFDNISVLLRERDQFQMEIKWLDQPGFKIRVGDRDLYVTQTSLELLKAVIKSDLTKRINERTETLAKYGYYEETQS